MIEPSGFLVYAWDKAGVRSSPLRSQRRLIAACLFAIARFSGERLVKHPIQQGVESGCPAHPPQPDQMIRDI